MKGLTLLSDRGHLLLWCYCGDCRAERAERDLVYDFEAEDGLSRRDHERQVKIGNARIKDRLARGRRAWL